MMERFIRMTLIFLIVYFALQLILPDPNAPDPIKNGDIGIKMVDSTVPQGNLVKVLVQNNMQEAFVLSESQNPPEKLKFERRENGRWVQLISEKPQQIKEPLQLAPQERREFSFTEFNTELFFPLGEYRVVMEPSEGQKFEAAFEIYKPGFFRTLFRAVYKLVYNAFILLLMLGSHSLGLAIILITLIIKLLLWTFNQHALESQQKMQKIQPELQRIREKYKDDQQKMASETMGLWKKHKISPFAAFTPLLIQFPVLIALFYVIRDGLLPHNTYLLYPPLQNFDFSQIQEIFLGIFNLANHPINDYSLIWLPFIVAISQFWAMKLSFKRAQKKKEQDKEKQPKDDEAPSMMGQMETMNKTMTYMLPLMILFFTMTFPAGVGLYWWISTLIGVGQQHIVNKKIQR